MIENNSYSNKENNHKRKYMNVHYTVNVGKIEHESYVQINYKSNLSMSEIRDLVIEYLNLSDVDCVLALNGIGFSDLAGN